MESEIENLKEELRLSNEQNKSLKDAISTSQYRWTCFHCQVTFRSVGGAEDHFGARTGGLPKCKHHDMDVEKLEKELEAVKKERDQLNKIRATLNSDGEYLLRERQKLEAENAELKAKLDICDEVDDETQAMIESADKLIVKNSELKQEVANLKARVEKVEKPKWGICMNCGAYESPEHQKECRGR